MVAATQVTVGNIPQIPDPGYWSSLLQQLLDCQSLTSNQAADLMQGWLIDVIPPVVTGAILVAIQAKGVSPEELVGMVGVLQSLCIGGNGQEDTLTLLHGDALTRGRSDAGNSLSPSGRLPLWASSSQPLIDTCGTGGDGASTFNISTAVAFVAAAAGVKVAKHGNRSASSKTGSADVLEAVGINLNAEPEKVRSAVDEVGITFLFAPGWHPALKSVAAMRKTLKVRTIFNLLGPLVNPMGPTGQIIGVYNPTLIETVASALSQLGTRRAIALYGREKLDEAGLADATDLAVLHNQQVSRVVITPNEVGLNSAPTSALQGGDVEENAEILKKVLQGKGTQAQQDVVALNASLALWAGEVGATDIKEACVKNISLVKQVLRSGEAWTKVEQLADFLR